MEQRHRGVAPGRAPEEISRLPATPSVVFDVFRLDWRDERLWCGQEVVPLPPKTLAVLCCLVMQAGQLVTKDALLRGVCCLHGP
jgi:DNA-binding response OmpR family regulator